MPLAHKGHRKLWRYINIFRVERKH